MSSLMKMSALALALTISGTSASFAADKVKMGTEGAYAPFNYVEANGDLKGFDIDIANAVCAEMKADCEWSTHEWGGNHSSAAIQEI